MDYQTFMEFVPIPDIMESKKVLFVGPHPDDIEIGCGGLVSELVDLGVQVRFLIATDGGSGSIEPIEIEELVEIRKKESIDSGKFLRVDNVEILDFPDGGIYNVDDLAVEIAKRIIDFKPDTVFCPDPYLETEIHPDHISTARATTKALIISRFRNSAIRHGLKISKDTKLAKAMNLGYFFTNRQNYLIPVSKVNFEKKIESIKIHKSQFAANLEKVKLYAYYRATILGKETGSEYAEGYYVMAPVHQHCFLEKVRK